MYHGVDTNHTLTQEELDSSGILRMPASEWNGRLPPRLLCVTHNGQPTKTRRYTVLSTVTPTSGLGVYNNTVRTVERALLERYFMIKTSEGFQPPLPADPRIFVNDFFTMFSDQVSRLSALHTTVLSDVQTVALYSGPKQRLYHNAMISLCRVEVNKRDAKIKQFPKMEKQAMDKAPRIINPRSPRYNLEVARYLKLAEKVVYRSINTVWRSVAEHTIIKGLNCYDAAHAIRMKWERFQQPVAIGLDATKWDAHVSIHALRYEHGVYNKMFRSKELARLLKWQLVNHGKSYNDDGTVEFIIEGTRASGDINTSLGNCLIASAILWAYCAEYGIVAELCNNGDDCVIILERTDVEKFMSGVYLHYKRCGFRIEVEPPVACFEQLEFCQTRPIFDGSRWRMMRNPLACLKKDGMCLLPITSRKTYEKWLGAVGECGLAAASGLPILQAWYSMFQRAGRTCPRKFKRFIFAHTFHEAFGGGLSGHVTSITNDARVSFYLGTGVTPDLQIAYERYFDSVDLSSEFVPSINELHTCSSIPIIELAPDIFDNSKNLNTSLSDN